MANKSTQFKKGMTPWNKGRGTFVSCVVCGVDKWFQNWQIKNPVKGKFCSKKCCYLGRELKGTFEKGHADFVPKESRGHSEETKKKISQSGRGKHGGSFAWNWIEDRTLLKDDSKDRGGQLHREWSKSVKNRDGWKCKISNGDCSGQVVAHHILSWREYVELRYEVNNGITLCHFHHPRKRKDEMKLSPFLQELVGVKEN